MNIGSVLVGAGSAPPPAAATSGAAATTAPRPSGAATSPATSFLDGVLGLSQPGAQRRAEELGALLTRFARGALTGSVASAATTSSTSSSLAFLKDGRLSVEEKLARLMVYLSDKYDKQLEQKIQQYSNLESGKATSSSSKSSSSGSTASGLKEGLASLFSKGGLGKLLSGSGAQKLLGQLAGPVLASAATALGLPTLAPLILKAGPMLGSVASGALSALTGGTASSSTSAKSASSSGSASSADAPSEKQLMTEIQILQEKQKEMFSLVSNILRAQHDTRMAVISNVR